MLTVPLTNKERIIKAKVSLNDQRPFFSYILMNMNVERTKSTENVPTMGVNRYGDLFWNEDFVKDLTNAQLKGVLAHEVMHITTLTFAREKYRDHMLWNMATDCIINYIILKEGFELPTGPCVPKDDKVTFDGKDGKVEIDLNVHNTAEDVYTILEQNAEAMENGYGDGNGGYEGSFDKHLEGDQDSEGNAQGKEKSDADKKENDEYWKKVAVDAATSAKMKGHGSSEIERLLEGLCNPKIDWRRRLNQFISKEIPVDYTMKRPGRKFYSTGVYYPSIVRENLEVCVGIDISGSISDDEYAKFISECVGIADGFTQVNMRMIWWACSVHPEDDILLTNANKNQLVTRKPKGGGGTHMSCFAEHVKEKGYNSRIYVILTDGFIESTPKVPNGNVLFVLSKNGSEDIIKNYGTVCSLEDSGGI